MFSDWFIIIIIMKYYHHYFVISILVLIMLKYDLLKDVCNMWLMILLHDYILSFKFHFLIMRPGLCLALFWHPSKYL